MTRPARTGDTDEADGVDETGRTGDMGRTGRPELCVRMWAYPQGGDD
ncbi:hypothetical protein ACH4S8_14520 [Streptomyces sp. NPDC021080]